MLSTTASTARPASALDKFEALATASTSSALFILIPYLKELSVKPGAYVGAYPI